MSIRPLVAIAGSVLVFASATAPAAADWLFGRPLRPYDHQVAGYFDRYGRPSTTERCIKMCVHDTLPCDPIQFKLGDGRCTQDDAHW